jgi:hypothetical protein
MHRLCGKTGWSAIAFSQQEGIDYATAIFFVWVKPRSSMDTNDGIYVARLASHRNITLMVDVSTVSNAMRVFTQYSLYDLLEFSVVIPSSELLDCNINYVYFACNPYEYPTINTTTSNGSRSSGSGQIVWNVPTGVHTSISSRTLGSFNDSDARSTCQLVSNMFPKVSDLYFGLFITEAIVWLLCIPIFFLFWNHQPLKSRGIIPLASVVFNYSVTMTSLQNFITDLEWAVKYDCLLYGLLIQPAFLIMSTLLFLNYFRYILVVNINRNKQAVYAGKESMHIRSIKILKTLSSGSSMVAIVIGLFLLCVVFTLVVYGSFRGYCTEAGYLVLSAPLYLSILPFWGMCGLFAYDWISNCRKIFIKCKWKEILLDSDPYYYRVEQWIGCIAFILFCPVVVFIIVMAIINSLRVQVQQDVYLALAIMTTICIYGFSIYLYGFVVSVTIAQWTCRKIRPPKHLDTNDQLDLILRNEDLLTHFTIYAKQEWSLENLAAYIEIENYKKKPSMEVAQEIYKKYLNGADSPCEVNINPGSRSETRNSIDHDEIKTDLFDLVQKGIRSNLSDTYSRFINTTRYITWKTNYDLQMKEMQ